ncbi:acetate--CoA ligase [Pseudalkalibacillus hwajinpoensis]|uniref:acetate--CoA ligase n=1 Tax=Guptibacillus hwajinpoensis TaxID=208199 RepID=A0A4U1MGB1_9BACL|nr:acetate--CoA ligase [Pseudalkalibacillus hwajinpoensis]TKD69330.1 acetate--CoA ligase [Pseudalkalibacillus hwajinpoensis]
MTIPTNQIPSQAFETNLGSYEEIYSTFEWQNKKNRYINRSTGKMNAAYECIDRHVENGYGNKTALHYVNGDTKQSLTFNDVKARTDHYAAVLKKHGVEKGERVFIFLPKNPECYIAILAVIKVGAIAAPLFEAFMEEAVKDRINDCGGTVLLTDEELKKRVPVKDIPSLRLILTAKEVENTEVGNETPVEWVDPENGLILHYTSGSTGKPKGVLHVHRSIVHHYQTGHWVLDLKESDVYWCTSHPGWVTGSVYGLFAPWLNRATIVISGGRFDADQWYSLIDQLNVTVWYSAPTAFRMLMANEDRVQNYNLNSLRHILSVGEPLNPEVIQWASRVWGKRIHDTWWMTETGGHLIVNFPGEVIKLGSMGRPFPGVKVGILDEAGNKLPIGQTGQLAIEAPWPGLMKTVWNNPDKFESYFPYGGWYVSGDLAYQDEEGYIFFQGRDDDMINSSGERIGPFEVESALITHPAVAEAGVVGKPDQLRGEIVKAYITLRTGYEQTDELIQDIRLHVRKNLAAHAAPREIEVLDELPKTKISGKILRRVLKERSIQ